MADRGELARNRVGQVLREKLTLEAVIGVGGMATVYAATHRNGKRVAVKMLHPELSADADAKARFLREGYAANTIGHPGCVSVTDDDVAEDGSVFVVMELLEGETLSNRAERAGGRLPSSEVVHWTLLLLDVLAAAHDKGVIHRDLKPENIFVTKENAIKVLDFGIARTRATSQAKLTVTGSVMGTPAFMPPEQALAKWDLVDGRSDLWAVGATMFFLLTGRLVHEEDALTALLIAISTKPVVPIASVLPTIPPALAAIVDRALALDRERRFPDARAMQAALREAVATSPELLPSLVIVPATPGTRATTLEQMHGETLSSSPSLTPSLPEIVAKPQEQVETLLASGGTLAQKPKRPILPAIIAGVLALGILI
ncbi:MAG TPA: serine/threonine-protein kinase, partial [Polyangium sp.]|nr:serine/threonine-protein kinase [Polyangium sp.]